MKGWMALALMIAGSFAFLTPTTYADDRKSDADILGLLMAVDQNEIDAAGQAERKNIDPEVMDYAKMLDNDHSQDLQKLKDLSAKTGLVPPASAGAMIKANGAKGIALRTVQNGPDFEKSYIEDMIKGHEQAIAMVDKEMPDVQNPDLKAAMANGRSVMAKHLDRAKEIYNKMWKA